MRIVVLVKQVPDTWDARRIDPATGRVDRAGSARVIDDLTERAVEAALAVKEQRRDVEVVALTMGPADAAGMLKKVLALGPDRAVHVLDDGLVGADMVTTARVLAAAVRDIGFDLVLGGDETTDGRGGMVPALLAELLGVPLLAPLASLEVDVDARRVTAERRSEWASLDLEADLPAVATVTERFPEARFASFKGLMGAKRKPLDTVTLGDLGIEADATTARTRVLTVTPRPLREAGVKIVDHGDGAEQLAEFLAAERII